MTIYPLILTLFLSSAFSPAYSQAADEDKAPQSVSPVYVSLEPDLNEYYLYANGGWDGNWFVGYNNCWIVKLPPVPEGTYEKAFIGAKLGRAKSANTPENPFDFKPIEGKIYMGISQAPAFTSQQSFMLTDNEDIPLEPLPNENLAGVDSSQWFWTEVPLQSVSQEKPNYLALWSDSEFFLSSSSSPIIAGAETKTRQDSVWVNRSVRGVPPRDPENALETPVFYLQPAMVIKLVPANSAAMSVENFSAKNGQNGLTVGFTVTGQDVQEGWVEISYDRFDWQRISRYLFRSPFSLTLDRDELPSGKYYIRAAARDMLENTGYCVEIQAPPLPDQQKKPKKQEEAPEETGE